MVSVAYARRGNRSTLVVVHDRAEAWALADRVVVLLGGGIAAGGTPTDVLETPTTPALARFVGFAGRLQENGGSRYLRPSDVRLDPDGPVEATARRRIPVEDGTRLELETPAGTVVANAPAPGPRNQRARATHTRRRRAL